MNATVSKQKPLIVEGRDEENFFTAALNHLAIADIQILGIGGKTNLASNLKALMNDIAFPTVTCLAIVRDADITATGSQTTAATGAFQSVRAALTARELDCPAGHGTASALQVIAGQ
jgi:hypothetical protein